MYCVILKNSPNDRVWSECYKINLSHWAVIYAHGWSMNRDTTFSSYVLNFDKVKRCFEEKHEIQDTIDRFS